MSSSDDPWSVWLDRHGPALVLYARQWCASHADAEDAVQEGFVRFWKGRQKARDRVAYLYTCVRSAAMDLSRGERRRRKREDERTQSSNVYANPFEQHELRVAVESALAALPQEQREVLVMKVWGGLTFAQIGEALSLSANTAASRYRYGLERLEAALANEVSHG